MVLCCKLPEWRKPLLHSEHFYGLSPEWTLMWLSRCPDWLNALSHMWHLYGFSPLWILLWLTRWLDCVNRLLQTVHSNGFSPEWLLMCTARRLISPVQWPHSVHLYFLLWIFIWFCRPDGLEKHFSHCSHVYTLFPVCITLCLFKLLFVVNRLSHSPQTYSFCPCCVILWSVNLDLPSASVFTSNEIPDRQTSTNDKM